MNLFQVITASSLCFFQTSWYVPRGRNRGSRGQKRLCGLEKCKDDTLLNYFDNTIIHSDQRNDINRTTKKYCSTIHFSYTMHYGFFHV